MFAKDKPTKKVPLPDNNWVELQYLSKGQKNMLSSTLSKVFKNASPKVLQNTENAEFSSDFIEKVQEVEYQKLAAAIKSWSADVPVTVENVKELDDESYDVILEAVNEMNGLSEEEEKN